MQAIRLGEDLAVIRFHRPDGQQNRRVDAEVAFDGGQCPGVLGGHLASLGNGVGIDARIEVVPDLGGEFGLVAGFFEHHWIRRGHAPKCCLVGRAGNAGFRGGAVKARDPLLKACIGLCRQRGKNTGKEAKTGGANKFPGCSDHVPSILLSRAVACDCSTIIVWSRQQTVYHIRRPDGCVCHFLNKWCVLPGIRRDALGRSFMRNEENT